MPWIIGFWATISKISTFKNIGVGQFLLTQKYSGFSKPITHTTFCKTTN